MSESSEENRISYDGMIRAHRNERKELQGKVQQLKKSAAKGDKKKKKEVQEEIIRLELELDEKQKLELDKFECNNASSHIAELSANLERSCLDGDQIANGSKTQKVTRAQKRRDKKAIRDKGREQEIANQEVANLKGDRHIEATKFKQVMAERNLKLKQVSPDGNCLYAAIADQLALLGISSSVQQLRLDTARHIRGNSEDFLPFLTNSEGKPFSAIEFESYCEAIETTNDWGGQLELRAITECLSMPVEVIQVDGPSILIGEQFKTKPTLLLSYHRHEYSLGEHYNSVIPAGSVAGASGSSSDHDEFHTPD